MVRGRANGSYWGVVLDAPDPAHLAAFYASVLGWTVHSGDENFVTVAPPDGVAYLAVQRQIDPAFVRPTWPASGSAQQMMMHLDIEVSSLDEAIADALSLGATLAPFQPQEHCKVLLDPVGHPFCLYVDTSITEAPEA